jgi:hypothetical protein
LFVLLSRHGFLAGLMFLPSLLAIADEVIEQSFRNASIDGGEVTSRVRSDRSCVDRAMSAVPPLAIKMLSRSKRALCGDPRSSQRRCCPAALVHWQISLSRRRLLHRGFDAGR